MRLDENFYRQDVIIVAKGLLGATLVRQFDDGQKLHLTITDVEVYKGEEDLACHASKGRTLRTEVMYQPGGKVYVYLIYGMYWLLNIVTGPDDHPQAVLIRGTREVSGPGRIGKVLQLDKSFYGEDLSTSNRLWIEPSDTKITKIIESPRIGVDYAGSYWSEVNWRFVAQFN